MLLPDATVAEAIAYMRGKAERYAQIARDHLDRAEVLSGGTDRIEASPVRAARFAQCATEAMALAQNYLGIAMALTALRPDPQTLQPGDLTTLPVQFLRRAANEDYPGEAFFRVTADQVVRAPLASASSQIALGGAA